MISPSAAAALQSLERITEIYDTAVSLKSTQRALSLQSFVPLLTEIGCSLLTSDQLASHFRSNALESILKIFGLIVESHEYRDNLLTEAADFLDLLNDRYSKTEIGLSSDFDSGILLLLLPNLLRKEVESLVEVCVDNKNPELSLSDLCLLKSPLAQKCAHLNSLFFLVVRDLSGIVQRFNCNPFVASIAYHFSVAVYSRVEKSLQLFPRQVHSLCIQLNILNHLFDNTSQRVITKAATCFSSQAILLLETNICDFEDIRSLLLLNPGAAQYLYTTKDRLLDVLENNP